MPDLSVILCTHNPRPDYLTRVLAALQGQTLPKSKWELLIIDNGSDEPLKGRLDLSWHPSARVICEETLGLTAARLRGISEATAETLIFVDDDNLLASDYLACALKIAEQWALLGAWGGSIVADFEAEPPAWTQPYLRYLTIREVTEDRWSNFTDQIGMLPWGAGLCVRKRVALVYADRVRGDPVRASLDRRGQSLATCGDNDLVLTACDLGLGTGIFACLRLTHLISAIRLQKPYLLRLMEGQHYSLTILGVLRGKELPMVSGPRWIWGHVAALRRGLHSFRFHRACLRGTKKAIREIRKWPPARSPHAASASSFTDTCNKAQSSLHETGR